VPANADHRPRLNRVGFTALLALGALALAACGGSSAKPTEGVVPSITIAAASDLRPAFEDLGATFTEVTGIAVRFSFGSSGQLREQIINGAPFDLFASANSAFVDEVIEAGIGVADTRAVYGNGRIVLWAPAGATLPESIEQLADPAYERIAIANPEHAPYGQAAEQALAAAGISDVVGDRLVFGENVSDALRIAKSGNADIGIVALSLAIADGGPYTLIPAELHAPLVQALVVTAADQAHQQAATQFAELLASPIGRRTMAEYGFTLPDDPLDEAANGG
jgi:molybdate transport system substrate-binding protein